MAKEYATPLRLVSPNVRGQNVKDAQYLLAGNNRFTGLAPYKDGKISGVYDLITAQATRRAKYWLGYPLASCDMIFGQTLYEYLRTNQWRPLPAANQTRRKARIAAISQGNLAVDKALTQLGVKEDPFGSNRQQYGKWYGWNGVPWCAIFESWCFAFSGYSKFHYASVEEIVLDAEAHRGNLHQVWTPQRGDLACFHFGRDPYAHTAFVLSLEGSTLHTVGGNTGSVNFSNGGEVAEITYEAPNITAYVRVG